MWMRKLRFSRFVPLLTGFLLAGCSSERGEDRVTYQVGGTIVRIEAARRSVVIAHEAIPGFMEPMTMPFEVRDSAILDGIKKGEDVKFGLVVQGNHAWITTMEPAGASREAQ